MIIRRLKINNFGKIHDRTLDFSSGINVLYGQNESGKTTIHTFIRSMLFGLPRMRGKAAKNDTFSSYEPWENSSTYGGSIWINSKNQNFRITRNFQKDRLSGEIYNEDSKELADADKKNMESVLGNVSEVIYDNTVSVAQLKSVTGQDLVRELENYMANYQGTGDSSIDLGRAEQMLKMTRKGFLDQEERKKKEIDKEQQKISAKMDYIKGEIDELKNKMSQLEEKAVSLHMKPGDIQGEDLLEEKIREVRKKRNFAATVMIAAAVIGIAVLTGGAVTGGSVWGSLVVIVITLALEILGGMKQLIYGRELQKRTFMKTRWLSRKEKMEWNLESLQQSCDEKETAYENLQEEYREFEENACLPSAESQEIQALNLAMSTIEKLSGNIQSRVGRKLRDRTSQILSEITCGKYEEVIIDSQFHMAVNTQGRIVALERLSRGTMEQIYFALRMAAGEILCQDEKFPVILDDVFGMYDEERLLAVLQWMYKEKRQIIISTCNKREMEILDREQIPYQKIVL